MLRVAAVVGRTLTDQDREGVAVISHRYWRRRFGADPGVIGRGLSLQGRSSQVSPVDPLTLAGSAAAILALALLAAYAPARRASRIDPVAAIRHE